ncbi:MAG: glycosyltransferase family 4 protein, partial [Rhodocyclaceae bacterium]|nr:glycosyltransferase family 4 protein [Rhodocyclaceae bacterium]
MRVLHVVRQFSPGVGGLENFVLCLARAQRAAGLDARVLTLDRLFHRAGPRLPATDEVAGIPVRRLGWAGSPRYPLAPGCLAQVRGHDLIHVHGLDFFADYLAATRALHGLPMVLSTHGGFFHSGYAARAKRLYFQTVTRASLRGYRRVLACSAGDYARFAPLCAGWLEQIDNGVDVEKFAAAGDVQCRPNFLFLGRFSDNKRLDRLIATMAHLVSRLPQARLTIAGRDWDGGLARLLDQIDGLGLDHAVQV